MSKKVIKINTFLFGATLFLASCSPKPNSHDALDPHQRPAPKSVEELGVVISGVSQNQIQKFVDEKVSRSYRVINKNHQLFEVYGESELNLKQYFSGSVESNKWIELDSLYPTKKIEAQALVDQALTSSSFRVCNNRELKRPSAQLVIEDEVATKDIFMMGDQLQLSGVAEANREFPSELTSGFIVQYPEGALLNEQLYMGPSLELSLDAMGVYTVLYIVQDARDACARASKSFAVTGNQAFRKDQAASVGSGVDLEQFEHLSKVSAQPSWLISQGEGVTIAVIDTGVNYNHSELAPNIVLNSNEIPNNGIDDDLNGFVDDYLGYDFAYQDAFPFDDAGHGSHVAGLAASPTYGLAPKAKILAIKALSAKGGDVASIAGAIFYAVDRGAQIINLSLGAPGLSHPALIRALNYTEEKGVLVLAGAGNGDPMTGRGVNNDLFPFFPASYPHGNLVSVTSHADDLGLSPYANLGIESVHVAAPGGYRPKDEILSAFMYNPAGIEFVRMSGTSMATPIVAGIAAQILAINPDLQPQAVRRILIEGGVPSDNLKQIVLSGRQIKADLALELTLKTVSL